MMRGFKRKWPLSRRVRYAAEAALVYFFYGFFRLFPLDIASAIGGFIGRHIGPHMGISRVARKNLDIALPEKTAQEKKVIITGMWDNLGRVVAEYPHLHRISGRVEIVGGEIVRRAMAEGGPFLLFCAHTGNWEVCSIGLKNAGVPIHVVYRRPNNETLDGLLRYARSAGAIGQIEKGVRGAQEILSVMKSGGVVGMLTDQKMSNGISLPFFGQPAMTAPAIEKFQKRFGCPVFGMRVERLRGARLRVTVTELPPEVFAADREEGAMTAAINDAMESWIRQKPEQWLWLHRRWG